MYYYLLVRAKQLSEICYKMFPSFLLNENIFIFWINFNYVHLEVNEEILFMVIILIEFGNHFFDQRVMFFSQFFLKKV